MCQAVSFTPAFQVTHLSKTTFIPAKLHYIFTFTFLLNFYVTTTEKVLIIIIIYFRAGLFFILFASFNCGWGCNEKETNLILVDFEVVWIYGNRFHIIHVFRLPFAISSLCIPVFSILFLTFSIVTSSRLLLISAHWLQIFVQPKHPGYDNVFTLNLEIIGTLCLKNREKIQEYV